MIPQQATPGVSPVIMLLVFVTCLLLTVATIILSRQKKMTRRKSAIFLIISMIGGGFLLGALPNPIQPINQLLLALRGIGLNLTLVPMVLVLVALLASTLLAGRAFCSHACPLGAMQELLSLIKFKAAVTGQRGVKGRVTIPERAATFIRIIVFAAFIIVTITWGISIIQLTSPFLGFRVFMAPGIAAIAIPVAMLATIAIASVFVYRPWCRLACPFGTLAWLTSRTSKYKLRRTSSCTDCKSCEQACPTNEAARGTSKSNCFLCNRCIDACPKDAIVFDSEKGDKTKHITREER
ncbi:MAG: 4Fe-4S binding protein [Candidatus Lokiarchaeota archaeon]|nr:4Fe-4S binding protein [Candidatus Lokiarchaeota archaeon]